MLITQFVPQADLIFILTAKLNLWAPCPARTYSFVLHYLTRNFLFNLTISCIPILGASFTRQNLTTMGDCFSKWPAISVGEDICVGDIFQISVRCLEKISTHQPISVAVHTGILCTIVLASCKKSSLRAFVFHVKHQWHPSTPNYDQYTGLNVTKLQTN
jgi:hypothetical protein